MTNTILWVERSTLLELCHTPVLVTGAVGRPWLTGQLFSIISPCPLTSVLCCYRKSISKRPLPGVKGGPEFQSVVAQWATESDRSVGFTKLR